MKIKNKRVKVLTDTEIKTLGKVLQTVTFHRSAELFYKGHVPHVGYILLQGVINQHKGARDISSFNQGSVIGVWELVNGIPSKITAKVEPQTVVGILDRSTIQEILQNEDPSVRSILKNVLAP